MKPDGTNGVGVGVGVGLLESSLDFLEKTIARIIPIRIRTPTVIPIIIFLFLLLGYLS